MEIARELYLMDILPLFHQHLYACVTIGAVSQYRSFILVSVPTLSFQWDNLSL